MIIKLAIFGMAFAALFYFWCWLIGRVVLRLAKPLLKRLGDLS